MPRAMSDSVAVVRETERKYEADDAVVLLDPARLLGLDPGSQPEEQQLEAIYFDTPDLRLLRAGVTLRRRKGGADEGWHLKLPAGQDSRDELRLPLTRARSKPPAEFVALTRLNTRGTALGPVAQLNTQRRRWVLADAEGHELAELVEDQVNAHTMGKQTTAVSWREVEVELGEHGQVELLDRIERELLEVGAHRSSSGSKLGRLLADQLQPPAGKDSTKGSANGASKASAKDSGKGGKPKVKRGSAGEAVLAYLGAQAEQLRAQDPLVRRDALDAVHQMRVAARRMRSVLQAYGNVIDGEATRGLTDELKWLGGELAGARDSEVIEERLTSVLHALPDDAVLGPVAAQLTRSLQRRGAEGREAALAALDSDRYLALHDAVDQLLADPPLTARASRPARKELARGVAKVWRRMENRMASADAAAPGEEHDIALHEARKSGKRLRYALEVAEPSVGKPAERFRLRAKDVHTLLGDHQDAVVARPVLRELAAQAHLDGGNGFTHGVLYGLEVVRAERAERELPEAWRRLGEPANTKWLKS
jgi:CHAD domain-containing protein